MQISWRNSDPKRGNRPVALSRTSDLLLLAFTGFQDKGSRNLGAEPLGDTSHGPAKKVVARTRPEVACDGFVTSPAGHVIRSTMRRRTLHTARQ